MFVAFLMASPNEDFRVLLPNPLRISLAPHQRLTDHFVFIGAGDMPQKLLASFLVNERSERTALHTPPGMQLDRKLALAR